MGKLIINYLLSLIWHWYSGVIAALDLVGLVIILDNRITFQPWVYFVIVALEFFAAGFIVYYDDQKKYQKLKEDSKKQIDSITAKIIELEDRIPKLQLFFKVGNDLVERMTLIVGQKPTPPDFDMVVEEERKKLSEAYISYKPEYKEFSDDPTAKIDEIRNALGSMVNSMQISREEYDKGCREYIKEYRSYLISQFNHEYGQKRYRTIQLAVKNVGNVICRTIVVKAHFPEEFHFFSSEEDLQELALLDDFRNPMDKPTPPKVARSLHDLMSGLSNLASYINPHYPDIPTDLGPRNVSGPYFKKTQSIEIGYDIDELLYNFIEDSLDELCFVVLDEAIGRTWEIPYEIHAEALPNPIHGTLIIDIKQES